MHSVNFFKYKYNQQDANYNDGYIDVLNSNLPESKTVIQSKIYSPEYIVNTFDFQLVNVYKIWDKNIKDNGTVEYKPLENHFYFMRSQKKI